MHLYIPTISVAISCFILYSHDRNNTYKSRIVVLLCLTIHYSAFSEVSMRKEAIAPSPTHKFSTVMP